MNRDNIICTCNGVTIAQIEKAALDGARTFQDLQDLLHIGKQCIKCKEMASFILEGQVEELEGLD